MAWAISINGYSIQSIAESVSITSIVYLATVSILHGLYELIPVQRQIAFHEASTKARKILVLNWRDINHKWAGGAEVYVNEIIQIWAKQGHEVTLFCGNDGTQKIREERENITIIRRGNLYTSFIWAFLYYVKEFRGKFDVIVESDSALPFFTPLYSRTPKILIVYHVHQEVFTKYLSKALSVFAKFMERKAIPFLYKNTRVVTISESTKEDLIAMGINKENISVINPGIAETKPMKIRKAKAPLFSYIGRLQHYKNIDILIRAFAEVAKKKKDAQLIIAGFGESRYALETLVKELKMDKTITFAGKVTEKEKMQLFAMSWAAIQPSSYEGWGITVIEANACGTPVIASNVKGLKDSVVHNETGILVAPKRPKILAKAMLQIIKNPTKTREMEQEARNWASRFSWERTANLILLEAGYMKHVELNPLQFLSNE
jgi:glycosyltransferase involved in cell wall biosynthesis